MLDIPVWKIKKETLYLTTSGFSTHFWTLSLHAIKSFPRWWHVGNYTAAPNKDKTTSRHKKGEYRVFNVITADLLLWAALIFTVTKGKAAAPILEPEFNDHWILSAAFLGILPLIYITLVILHHLIRRFRGQKAGDGLTSSQPHRLLHPDQYRGTCGYIATISVHCEQSSWCTMPSILCDGIGKFICFLWPVPQHF